MQYNQIHEIENLSLLVKMIGEGYDVNAYDSFGLTPLHYAENPEVIRILIAAGADIHKKSNDLEFSTPFERCEDKDILRIYKSLTNKHQSFNLICAPSKRSRSWMLPEALILRGARVSA